MSRCRIWLGTQNGDFVMCPRTFYWNVWIFIISDDLAVARVDNCMKIAQCTQTRWHNYVYRKIRRETRDPSGRCRPRGRSVKGDAGLSRYTHESVRLQNERICRTLYTLVVEGGNYEYSEFELTILVVQNVQSF